MIIFTVFLKTRKFISKIRISKVADYAALKIFFSYVKIKCSQHVSIFLENIRLGVIASKDSAEISSLIVS